MGIMWLRDLVAFGMLVCTYICSVNMLTTVCLVCVQWNLLNMYSETCLIQHPLGNVKQCWISRLLDYRGQFVW